MCSLARFVFEADHTPNVFSLSRVVLTVVWLPLRIEARVRVGRAADGCADGVATLGNSLARHRPRGRGMNVIFASVDLLDHVAVQLVASVVTATLVKARMTSLMNVLRAPSMRQRMERIRIALTRWAWVCLLAVVGAAVFQIVLHEVWKRVQGFDLPFAWWFIWLATSLVTGILLYAACEPLHMRRGHWRTLIRYPHTWVAVLLAMGTAGVIEWLPGPLRARTAGPDWQNAYTVLSTAFIFAVVIAVHHFRSRRPDPQVELTDAVELTWPVVRTWIAAGERAESSVDFFRHKAIATRIARLLEHGGQSVALLGPVGSGKSTILGAVRAELAARAPHVIVASFDMWAVPKPTDVPRLALSRIVAALDEFVDTIEFRGVPTSYQQLVSAEPTGTLSKFLGFDSTRDSAEELERFSPMLQALNLRVVLMIEDAERVGKAFENRHLQRLLWALARKGHSYVLAVDPAQVDFAFDKLCETIELVPPLTPFDVARLLAVAYGHWRGPQFAHIDSHPNRREKGDKLQVRRATEGGLVEYMEKTGQRGPLFALLALVGSPRALKQLLRRVDRVWRNLHGEVELDDVVIVAALRLGAAPVFNFLLSDIDPARHKPDRILPRTEAIPKSWAKVIKTLAQGEAAQRLVDLMGIEQLSRRNVSDFEPGPQDTHEYDPVDYVRRIVAEDLAPGELRDQTVLRDLDEWTAGKRETLVAGLVNATDADDTYSRRWEHFASRHGSEQLIELAGEVADRVVARDGASAAADHPALISIWRATRNYGVMPETAAWVEEQSVKAVPVSMRFVNTLYYFWTGHDGGVTTSQDRIKIRRAITDGVRSTHVNGTLLANALYPKEPFHIVRLITQTGEDSTPAAFSEWSDFAEVLLDGARLHPEILIPELANLAGDRNSGTVGAMDVYPPNFAYPYTMERENVQALFGDRVDELLMLFVQYSGANAWALRPKEEASRWLGGKGTGGTSA